MNVINKQARHRQFGVGKISSQSTATVTVEFGEPYGVKNFVYPSAFKSFLELCDPVLKEKMDDELRQIQELADAEKNRREDERRAILEQIRAAEKKRAPAKKTTAKAKKLPKHTSPTEEGTAEN